MKDGIDVLDWMSQQLVNLNTHQVTDIKEIDGKLYLKVWLFYDSISKLENGINNDY